MPKLYNRFYESIMPYGSMTTSNKI